MPWQEEFYFRFYSLAHSLARLCVIRLLRLSTELARVVIIVLNTQELIIITHPLVVRNCLQRSGQNNRKSFSPEYCGKCFRLIYSFDLYDVGFS